MAEDMAAPDFDLVNRRLPRMKRRVSALFLTGDLEVWSESIVAWLEPHHPGTFPPVGLTGPPVENSPVPSLLAPTLRPSPVLTRSKRRYRGGDDRRSDAVGVHARVVADLEAVAARAAAAARRLESAGGEPNDVVALQTAANRAASAATELRRAQLAASQQRML